MAAKGFNHRLDPNRHAIDFYYGESLIDTIPIARDPEIDYDDMPVWRQDKIVAAHFARLFRHIDKEEE